MTLIRIVIRGPTIHEIEIQEQSDADLRSESKAEQSDDPDIEQKLKNLLSDIKE